MRNARSWLGDMVCTMCKHLLHGLMRLSDDMLSQACCKGERIACAAAVRGGGLAERAPPAELI
jgi:hypothetical protein